MPNIKSAVKRMRQNQRRRQRNRHHLSKMRTEIKRFRRLLVDEKSDEAKERLSQVYSIIDHTAQKGVIHRNTAARYKSRLTSSLNQALGDSTAG